MLNILAKSYLIATRNETYNHWGRHTRYDTRRSAEIEMQKTGGKTGGKIGGKIGGRRD